MDEPTWLSDTLHCPMIPPTLLQFEQSEAVAAAGLAQGTLVEELLPWTGSEFLSDLLRLRSEIDETLHAADDGLTPEMRAKYPLGACKPIRDAGLARLLGCSAADETRPAFQAIRRFRSRGGLVKGIWGIQKGIYFQNAIQAGDLWVDLANDTVDRTRVPVEICRLADAQFEEIESFGRFAEVTRAYWGPRGLPKSHPAGGGRDPARPPGVAGGSDAPGHPQDAPATQHQARLQPGGRVSEERRLGSQMPPRPTTPTARSAGTHTVGVVRPRPCLVYAAGTRGWTG